MLEKLFPMTFPPMIHRIFLGFVITMYFVFGWHHLSQFATADEHYWVYERIPQYWNAIAEHKWTKTFINDKPGITLALVSGIAILPYPDTEKHCEEREDRTLDCDTEVTEGMYLAFRLPILIANGLLLVFLFFLIERLCNSRIALFTTLLAALSPILLGSSQIINPDSLLWSCGMIAIFSYFSLLRFEERKYLLLTILFTALAILSKYVAIILLPFFLALTVLRFLSEKKPTDRLHQLLKKDLTSFGFLSLGVIFLVCLFLPALLMDSKYFLEFIRTVPDKEVLSGIAGLLIFALLFDTYVLRNKFLLLLRSFLFRGRFLLRFSGLFFLVLFVGIFIARSFFQEWSIFSLIPFDIKDLSDARYTTSIPNFFEAFLLEWNPLVFSLTPLVLFGLASLFVMLAQKSVKKNVFLIYTLFFFFLLYTVLLIYSNILTTPRYSILLYPLFAFLAALGYDSLMEKYSLRSRELLVTMLVFLGSLAILITAAPFYFNYTNSLLPKNLLIQDAWGYGGYEAAQYLNSLPEAENLTVWADYYGVCEFFVGRCLTAYTFDKQEVRPDYYVLTRRGQMRYMSRSSRWERLSGLLAYRYYNTPAPDWQLFIGGRPGNFVKVVKVDYSFRASIITDIDHCPSREAVSEEQLQSFLSFSQEKDVDFQISLGDNASHRLRNCSLTGDGDARYIAERLRSSGRPTHFVLGDHDIASSVASYEAWLQTIGKEKTYYSFDQKDVHVVVLDTVLGGEPLQPSCDEDAACAVLKERLNALETLSFKEYREKYQDSLPSRFRESSSLTTKLEEAEATKALTRSFGVRDQGQVSEEELTWLAQDLEESELQKVVVFSDHPLFPFTSSRKEYDIVNGKRIRTLLEESGKEVVVISGEAHLWHEETLNGIRYYIVDEFRKANGSWAYFRWDENGPSLEKVTH